MGDPRHFVELTLSASDPAERRDEPVTCGLPWPRGRLADDRAVRLLDPSGKAVPVQVSVLDRWSDGSARWAMLRWRATFAGRASWRLEVTSPPKEPPRPPVELHADPEGGGIRIDTGKITCRIEAGNAFPFAALTASGKTVIDPGTSGFEIEGPAGEKLTARVIRLELEESGPLYARVRLDCGLLGAEASNLLRVFSRLSFRAGSTTVRFDLTIRNSRRARHAGGIWELGDPGSYLVRSASLRLALPGGAADRVFCSPTTGAGETELALPFELHQESSGGENWNPRTHVNRDGVVPLRFRGFRLRSGDRETRGLRAEPVVRLERGDEALALAVPRFWANFPKAIESDGHGITFHLFPPRTADLHELQGGEQKTHTFYVAFGNDRVSDPPLAWCRSPLRARADPEWYCASGAVPNLVPCPAGPQDDRDRLLEAAVEGPESFLAKRERIDEYGWRNFGELYADHEAAFHSGSDPLVSHYNNQYDAIAGFALQFLRAGDFRWWQLMDELAAHVADVDVYHTDGDKAAYNRGLFWHTYHYVDAGKSTHRSYPRAPGIWGGGPSNEHAYTSGLLLHHFLTGDPLSRETVLDLARWVIDMDDGGRTVFRWLSRAPTGLASGTAEPGYHGPGRGAGNSINALLDGFLLSRDRAFLGKAEELIRRCIHPEDDIEARNLPDAERRWSYLVFLQKLGRYLDVKAELDELDSMYAYARAALLRYARWIVEHEYPYLDRPEILEYPTETWAAQDLRKSDVLSLAALHSTGEERRRLLERAEFFFRHSLESLGTMETRTRTRPLVILLTSGSVWPWLHRAGEASAPPPRETVLLGPSSFRPQKVLALRRARLLGALSLAIVAGAVLSFFFWR